MNIISGSGGQFSGLSSVVAERARPAVAREIVRDARGVLRPAARPVRVTSVEVAPVEVAPGAVAPGLLGRARDWWDAAPMLHRGAVVGAGLLLVAGLVVALKPASRNPPRKRASGSYLDRAMRTDGRLHGVLYDIGKALDHDDWVMVEERLRAVDELAFRRVAGGKPAYTRAQVLKLAKKVYG